MHYMAPEVENKQPNGFPADIYSFGCTCIHILSGRLYDKTLPLPQNLGKYTSLIMSCLAEDPKARPTILQVFSQIQEICGALAADLIFLRDWCKDRIEISETYYRLHANKYMPRKQLCESERVCRALSNAYADLRQVLLPEQIAWLRKSLSSAMPYGEQSHFLILLIPS